MPQFRANELDRTIASESRRNGAEPRHSTVVYRTDPDEPAADANMVYDAPGLLFLQHEVPVIRTGVFFYGFRFTVGLSPSVASMRS